MQTRRRWHAPALCRLSTTEVLPPQSGQIIARLPATAFFNAQGGGGLWYAPDASRVAGEFFASPLVRIG
jgi:hypothetical protein